MKGMEHDNVIERLAAMGFTVGYRAKVRQDDGVLLYPVDDLFLCMRSI
jgi:hypothetical protein